MMPLLLASSPGLSISSPKLVLVVIAFLVSVTLTIVFTPLTMWLARRFGVVDKPDARRVHKTPTPRWGGLAMFAAFALTVLLMFLAHFDELFKLRDNLLDLVYNARVQGLLIGAALITLVGAVDDKFQVPAKVKLLGQIFTAVLVVVSFFGLRFYLHAPGSTDPGAMMLFNQPLSYWGSVVLSVCWIVGITNTLNLIDGLDGLAAGVCGFAALSFLVINVTTTGSLGYAVLCAALVGACLGFLRYNFHPAKVFMGDAGSHFLGFTVAALSMLQNWKVATLTVFAIPVLIMAVPIFDTAFAIIRRLARRQPIFMPDRGHLHHRLLSMGLNQRTVVLIIYLLTGLGCLFAVMIAWMRH